MDIFGDGLSGNCYKVQLVCSILNLQHQWHRVDILNGGARTADFLALNPNGKVPAVRLDNGQTLWESNAILFYLARNSTLLPSDPWLQAQILQWQFFEQYSHEPFIAVRRFIQFYLGMPESRQAEYQAKYEGGLKALKLMDAHLNQNTFFVANQFSIADISLFAYTHVAEQGGYELADFPAICNWIDAIKNIPGFVPMSEG